MRGKGKNFSLTNAPPPPDATTACMTRLREAMFDAVSEADITDIVKGLVKRAKEGDLGATKTLLTYVCPSPSVHIGIRTGRGTPVDEPETIDARSTRARPGSSEKIEAMRQRAARGTACFNPDDGDE